VANGGQAPKTVAQGISGRQLDKKQYGQLLLKAKPAGTTAAFMLGFQKLNFMSGDQG
jgi:hypothetical protein